jgi:hypothetical protein
MADQQRGKHLWGSCRQQAGLLALARVCHFELRRLFLSCFLKFAYLISILFFKRTKTHQRENWRVGGWVGGAWRMRGGGAVFCLFSTARPLLPFLRLNPPPDFLIAGVLSTLQFQSSPPFSGGYVLVVRLFSAAITLTAPISKISPSRGAATAFNWFNQSGCEVGFDRWCSESLLSPANDSIDCLALLI